jgi:hypothetical protein
MQSIEYYDYPAQNTEVAIALELNHEKRRNRSLRKMLVAQTIYTIVVTAACILVFVAR